MAIEIVILTPVMFMFCLLIVAGGRLVQRQGEVDSAARDAARAGSLQRSFGAASSAAAAMAHASLPNSGCTTSLAGSNFVAGGQVTATVACRVDLSDIGLPGLPGSVTVTGRSASPLDVYRRTEGG